MASSKTETTSATRAQTGKGTRAPEATKRPETPDPKPRSGKTSRAKRKTAKDSKRLSALSAALRVLQESGQPMSCGEMIEAMAAKGYWTSPGGKTPAATLYSAILREVQSKGNDARFAKTERGKFALAKSR